MTVTSKKSKVLSFFLSVVLTFSLFAPIFSLDATAATVAGDIETTPGMNSYSLFNSGSSGSGNRYSSTQNYDDSSYTNGGYDIYSSNSNLPWVRLGLSFTVSQAVTERAALTVYAYDVDEDDGERDYIYLVDETTGAKTKLGGYLSGMDSQWNTTTLYIDPSYFEVDHTYHFELNEAVSGWVVYIRTVAIRLVTEGTPIVDPDAPVITDHAFSATIDSSRRVNTNLHLKASENVNYTLEYAASVGGSQRGSSINQSITVTPDGTDKTVTFYLESGAPAGVYQIDVIVKDVKGNMVAIYTTTAGYSCYAVSYHSNGGSSNLPIDQNAYRRGDTVSVSFEYVPSREGFNFLGWATDPNATAPDFSVDSEGQLTFTMGSADVSLYAVWKIKPGGNIKPGTVLLVEDSLPWGYNSNTEILNKLSNIGAITSWDKVSSTDITASLLGKYAVVYIAGTQSLNTYANVSLTNADLEEYVTSGGVVVYGASISDKSIPLPFGVKVTSGSSSKNLIKDSTSPILTQRYSERRLFPEWALTGAPINSAYLTGLPEGSNVILTDTKSNPTLAELSCGTGKIIYTTHVWEYYYVNHSSYGSNRFAIELFDDLFLYALSSGKAEHTHKVEWEYGTRPTCTLGGQRSGKCEECGELVVEILSPLGHDYEITDSAPATCTEDGHTTMTCGVCGSSKHQIIFAKGHDFDEGGACVSCGFKIEVHNHNFTKATTAPACTTVGYTTYSCACGYSYRADYIDQLGHKWDEGKVTTEATCTVNGSVTYTCTECQATYEEIILASHSFTEAVTIEATCTTDGRLTLRCDDCGHEETEAIPAAHKWNEGTLIAEPTCSTPGSKECTCTVCGESATLETPKLGHNFYNGSCTVCEATIPDIVVPNESHPEYGMFFEIDDVISGYGPDLVNEYGVLLDFNKDANIKKVAVYLVQEGNMWRRCIACIGDNITYATYVPYLSYSEEIKYTGLNSPWINTFSLSPNKDGIWCYSNYTTIGVNLADAQGNLLLSLFDIGQAGAKTRVFDDLDEMVKWLTEDSDCISHFESEWIVDKEATTSSAGQRHKICNLCKKTVATEEVPPLAQVSLTSTSSAAGGIFEITVSIKNNPGILSAIFELTFGPELTLVEVRAGEALGSLKFTAPTLLESGCSFGWDGKSADSTDGDFLILVFKLSEGANESSVYNINLSYAGGGLLNSNGTSMDVTVENSKISVHNIPGDANNDGLVNVLDVVLLRRYLAGGYGVTPVIGQADLDGNGKITVADVILLRRLILNEA